MLVLVIVAKPNSYHPKSVSEREMAEIATSLKRALDRDVKLEENPISANFSFIESPYQMPYCRLQVIAILDDPTLRLHKLGTQLPQVIEEALYRGLKPWEQPPGIAPNQVKVYYSWKPGLPWYVDPFAKD